MVLRLGALWIEQVGDQVVAAYVRAASLQSCHRADLTGRSGSAALDGQSVKRVVAVSDWGRLSTSVFRPSRRCYVPTLPRRRASVAASMDAIRACSSLRVTIPSAWVKPARRGPSSNPIVQRTPSPFYQFRSEPVSTGTGRCAPSLSSGIRYPQGKRGQPSIRRLKSDRERTHPRGDTARAAPFACRPRYSRGDLLGTRIDEFASRSNPFNSIYIFPIGNPRAADHTPAPGAARAHAGPVLCAERRAEPHFINWQQDPQGNYLARWCSPSAITHSRSRSTSWPTWRTINPFDFFLEPEPKLARSLRSAAGAGPGAVPRAAPVGPLLAGLPRDVAARRVAHRATSWSRSTVRAKRRRLPDPHGARRRTPEETLAAGEGLCRDSRLAAGAGAAPLGLAARFVSGYLIQLVADVKPLTGRAAPTPISPTCTPGRGYLPGAGWIGLDPRPACSPARATSRSPHARIRPVRRADHRAGRAMRNRIRLRDAPHPRPRDAAGDQALQRRQWQHRGDGRRGRRRAGAPAMSG